MRDHGVATGLKTWLFFLLCFVLLGYPVSVSLCFGAVGGLAGGWIAAWWSAKVPSAPPATESVEQDQESPLRRMRNRWQRWRSNQRRPGWFKPSPSVDKRRRSHSDPKR